MRSKDSALMEQIHSYIDEYYLREEETPSTTDIAREFSISRSSAYRYLVAMAEKKLIGYADGIIQTALMMKCRTGHNPTPVVGSVICGDPAQEQECIEEYVSLPESIFGKGDFFILRARTKQDGFTAYITALEAEGDNVINSLKTDYRTEMDTFEPRRRHEPPAGAG